MLLWVPGWVAHPLSTYHESAVRIELAAQGQGWNGRSRLVAVLRKLPISAFHEKLEIENAKRDFIDYPY